MKNVLCVIALMMFMLVACASVAPAATATSTSTIAPTETVTSSSTFEPPTATATETPEPQYGWPSSPEQFRDVVISSDDLLSGKYQQWLETQSKPFDPIKIRTDLPLVDYIDGQIMYDISHVPNFAGNNAGKEPFRRYMSGVTTYQGVDYKVMPIEYFDPEHPDKNQWVVTVNRIWSKANELSTTKSWESNMNITVPLSTTTYLYTKISDPLVSESFAMYPDMANRIARFVNNNVDSPTNNSYHAGGDMSALSSPGIILLNYIPDSTSGLPVYK